MNLFKITSLILILTWNNSFTQKYSPMYFKTLNVFKLDYDSTKDESRKNSYKEYDGEYNYELEHDFFENIWFYTNLSSDSLSFQIFYSKLNDLRNRNIYTNIEAVQSYFESKYAISYFYDADKEKMRKSLHMWNFLDRYLKFEDFLTIIKPNIKVQLFEIIDTGIINDPNYYIFYNWDFFNEVQLGGNSNSLFRHIETIPHGIKQSYSNTENANICALKVLSENAYSTVDTRLKGLNFPKNFVQIHDNKGSSKIFHALFEEDLNFKNHQEYDVFFPRNRYFNNMYSEIFKDRPQEFLKEIDALIEFFSAYIKPYEIISFTIKKKT